MTQAFNMEIRNSGQVLSELAEAIKRNDKSNNIHLLYKNENEMRNAKSEIALQGPFGIKECALPAFFRKLGIRSLTLSEGYDLFSLTKYEFIVFNENVKDDLWQSIKNEQLITDLMLLFKKCRSVAFDEWAVLAGASVLLNGLLDDVLQPLNKKDLDFIFYLGDPAKTLFFQVDGLLDIINRFTLQGKVTFILDEYEAINLWLMLSGEMPNTTFNINTSLGLKKKCFSILRTMNLSRLLIYSVNNVILFSEDQQFIFARGDLDQLVEITAGARDKFITGFSFGLLSRLEMQHCIALGLIMLGAHTEINNSCNPADLLLHIREWIEEESQNNQTFLYQ